MSDPKAPVLNESRCACARDAVYTALGFKPLDGVRWCPACLRYTFRDEAEIRLFCDNYREEFPVTTYALEHIVLPRLLE